MRRSLKLSLVLASALALAATGCTKSNPTSTAPTTAADGTAPAKASAETATPPADTGPVATVNGAPVPRAEFDEMFDKMTRVYTKRGQDIPENVGRRHKKNILKRLVEKALLRGEITKKGIVVSPAELDEGLAKYKEMFRTEANFNRYLANSGTTLDKIKANIHYNKSLDKLLEKEGPIEVTTDKAREYYDKNKRRYTERERVQASHILLKVPKDATPEAEKATGKKAADISKMAKKKGANFGDLAKKYSQGPTAAKGGNLGYFTRNRMDKAFEAVAFKLKKGEVSGPVRSKFGYHVIKMFDHKPPGEKPFSDVEASILKLLESRERRLRKSRTLRELRKTAKIEQHIDIPNPEPRKRNTGATISTKSLKLPGKTLTLSPVATPTIGGTTTKIVTPVTATAAPVTPTSPKAPATGTK